MGGSSLGSIGRNFSHAPNRTKAKCVDLRTLHCLNFVHPVRLNEDLLPGAPWEAGGGSAVGSGGTVKCFGPPELESQCFCSKF